MQNMCSGHTRIEGIHINKHPSLCAGRSRHIERELCRHGLGEDGMLSMSISISASVFGVAGVAQVGVDVVDLHHIPVSAVGVRRGDRYAAEIHLATEPSRVAARGHKKLGRCEGYREAHTLVRGGKSTGKQLRELTALLKSTARDLE